MDIARLKDIDIVLEAPAIEYHLCGWPGQGFLASERRYQGGIDGRRVGSQAGADCADRQLRPGQATARRAIFYGFESAATNDICSTLWLGFHQLGSPISAYKFKATPREVSPSSLCSALHSPFLTIAFFSLQNSRRTNRGSRHRFSKLKDARPTVSASPPLSLSCPGISTFRHSKA